MGVYWLVINDLNLIGLLLIFYLTFCRLVIICFKSCTDYWFWGQTVIDYWFVTQTIIIYWLRGYPIETLLPCGVIQKLWIIWKSGSIENKENLQCWKIANPVCVSLFMRDIGKCILLIPTPHLETNTVSDENCHRMSPERLVRLRAKSFNIKIFQVCTLLRKLQHTCVGKNRRQQHAIQKIEMARPRWNTYQPERLQYI